MLFNSYGFIVFFPIVVIVYFLLPKRISYLWLLAASYYFYMGWNAKYALLLLASTIITYVCGVLIQWLNDRHPDKISTKKWVVAGSFILNLAILFFFKYFNFTIESINAVLSHTSLPAVNTSLDVLLPVGISFYTFQALGYTVDVYRGEIEAERNFFRYALFVSFFPQLVAGPIERSKNLLTQLRNPKPFSYERMCDGVMLMIWGYFLKLVIADRISIFVDNAYANVGVYDGKYLLIASMLFAIQIYCDFSGYTDIARGAARMMGISLMENFRHPYRAVSIQDFWRRWHISLTRWFTDYVYIPLGGNRKGFVKQCRNILIVFLLSGFWHGASWNFVVWGMIHGIYMTAALVMTRIRKGKRKLLPPVAGWVVTLLLVNVAWVFFRAPSLAGAWQILKQPFVNPLGGGISETMFFLGIQGTAALRLIFVGLSWMVLEQLSEEIYERCQTKRAFCMMAAVFVVMVTVVEFSWLGMMASGGENAFIYFRF